MKKIIAVIILGFILTGCSSNDATNTTRCHFLTTETSTTLTFISIGDSVQQEQLELTMDTVAYDAIKSNYDFIRDIKGVEFTTTQEDDRTTMMINIDYTVVELETLVNLGIMSSDATEIGIISLNEAVSELEGNGVTCLRNQ